jgi:hypothetical protein
MQLFDSCSAPNVVHASASYQADWQPVGHSISEFPTLNLLKKTGGSEYIPQQFFPLSNFWTQYGHAFDISGQANQIPLAMTFASRAARTD